MKNVLRSMLVTLAGCSIAATSLVAGGAAPANAIGIEVTQDACADVTVLGLKGKDFYEQMLLNVNSTKSVTIDPFGTFNTHLADNIKGDLPQDTTIKKVAVPYDYAALSAMPKGFGDADKFRVSMKAATEVVNQAISKTISACPQTNLVLAGTDIGAQVVHESLITTPEAARKQIAAVVLMGDPLYDSTDPSQKNYAGQGASAFVAKGEKIDPVRQAPGVNSTDWVAKEAPANHLISPLMAGRVMSICKIDDWSCNGPTGDGVRTSNTFPEYLTGKYLVEPAQWVAKALASMQTKPVPSAPPAPKCTDVIFIAARGSGEPEEDGQPVQTTSLSNHMTGYGNTIATMAYQVKSYLPKSMTTSFDYVAYQALSVGDAMSPLPSRYPRSVATGIQGGESFNNSPERTYEGGVKTLKEKIADCPKSKFMTLGYSQGGHAMHEIMMRLDRAERDRIYASILIADADRNKDDSDTFGFFGATGSFAAKDSLLYQGNGVMRVAAQANKTCNDIAATPITGELFSDTFKEILVGPTVALCNSFLPTDIQFTDVTTFKKYDDDMNSKILNVCSLDDVVCQVKGPDNANPATLIPYVIRTGFDATHVDDIHGNGYKNPAFYEMASRWGAGQLKGE